VCLGIYKAGLELVLAHEGAEQEAYVQELKNVLIRYLQPLIGDRTLTQENLTTTPTP
jgi:hypothetical protein